jgi:hypothetical protein
MSVLVSCIENIEVDTKQVSEEKQADIAEFDEQYAENKEKVLKNKAQSSAQLCTSLIQQLAN